MTLQECYEKIGGDYAEVLERLTKEDRIEKYAVKFLEDTTYRMLCEAKKAEKYNEVFLLIHTLKGVSQNLGFTKLYEACYEMTEAVRGGRKLQDEALFDAVSERYFVVVEVLKQFADEK